MIHAAQPDAKGVQPRHAHLAVTTRIGTVRQAPVNAGHGLPFRQQIAPVQQDIRDVEDPIRAVQTAPHGKRQGVAMHLGPHTRRDLAASGEIVEQIGPLVPLPRPRRAVNPGRTQDCRGLT